MGDKEGSDIVPPLRNRDGTNKLTTSSSMSSWMANSANPYVAPPEKVAAPRPWGGECSEETFNDLSAWAKTTAWSTAFGIAYGWGVGWRGSRHLSGKYDATSVYHGMYATFRVPLDVVHSSLSCAKWGFRIGAFTCALSGVSILLERQRRAIVKNPSALPFSLDPAGLPMQVCHLHNSSRPTHLAVDDAAKQSVPSASCASMVVVFTRGLMPCALPQVAPTAVAGAAIGGGYGYLRQGGVRALATWMLVGGGLASGAKVLEVSLDRTIVYLVHHEPCTQLELESILRLRCGSCVSSGSCCKSLRAPR